MTQELGSAPITGGFFTALRRRIHDFISQATGYGITTNIIDCYDMIIRLWRPGDRIYLFGFSRGAYTVRCVWGVLRLCGVPTKIGDGPLSYAPGVTHSIAKKAVKQVYEFTASWEREKATDRQKQLLDQRDELATQFRTCRSEEAPIERLASVRRTNWTCSFPASSFYEWAFAI